MTEKHEGDQVHRHQGHRHAVNPPLVDTGSASGTAHSHTVNQPPFSSASTGSHSHVLDLPLTPSTAASTADVMPYLQLLTCRKD